MGKHEKTLETMRQVPRPSNLRWADIESLPIHLKESLADVVDSYIEDCEREGKVPEKPFSGKITVRVSPTTHRRIAIKAASRRESMNQYIEELIERDTSDMATTE